MLNTRDQQVEETATSNEQKKEDEQIQSPETPSISAPKGGGAISSIGEKFQANPVTGTGNMSIPVALSPGRNGFTPELALSYDSGQGNSEFGMGWNVGLPSISRKTQKGLPKYQDTEESDIFLLAGSEDLIPKLIEDNGNWVEVIDDSTSIHVKEYRPRIEGLFAKIKRLTDTTSGISHWEVTTKDNITSVYGKSPLARIADPQDPSRVFEWMLEYTYDEKGNIIFYEYKKEDQSEIDTNLLSEKNRLGDNQAFNQVYLKKVSYSPDAPFDPANASYFSSVNWHFQLLLDYGEHDVAQPTQAEIANWPVRLDPFSSFRSGFEIRTYRLCRRFLMFHSFSPDLGANPYLVKSTDITFDENPVATRISSVKQICYESGQTPLEYPPVNLSYSKAEIDSTIYQHGVEDLQNLPKGVDGSRYRWTDLYSEGLSGVLIEDQNAWYFKRNLGDENYYKDLPANQNPKPEARLGSIIDVIERPSLSGQLTDINRDGTIDVAIFDNAVSGYYKRDTEGKWENFRPFQSNPTIDWNDPNLRQIDIDGDGFADLLITKENCFYIYPSIAENGFGPAFETLQSLNEEKGPKILFSDPEQSIYLADMSGDGLTDIVRIMNGAVCYWPNKGYGHFGAKVNLDNAPQFDHSDIFSQTRIRLADIDGSGTTDVIYIANDCVKYYPNQSGNSLGDAVIINHQLPTHSLTNITTLDILGNGTTCLVWSSPVEGDHPPSVKYIDLMGGVKPYLLTEVNNNMGSITRTKYAPSTKFYLRDERNGTPWITKLPFPVLVVERVEIWDEINRNRFVSKYAYHHGFYDGVEREFRGFGMVEQWDSESFTDFVGEGLFPPGYNASEEVLHVPPVHTKTWFHTGFYKEGSKILDQYRSEYWDGDSSAFSFSNGLELPTGDFELQREAARALKGSPLRQEVYSKDGTNVESNPFVVTENDYSITQIQPRASEQRDRDYASFQVIPAQTLSMEYERDPSDPRVSHQLTLETDEYGHVLKSAAAVYPRRTTAGYAEQDNTLITVSENTLINEPANVNFYRLGLPSEAKSYELTGTNPAGLINAQNLLNEFNTATEIAYEASPSTGLEKRLLSHSRVLYYDETLTSTPLPFGSVSSHALSFEIYQLALTAGQISSILNEGLITRVDPAIMSEGAYIDHLTDGNYWTPTGRILFDSNRFYLPTSQTDPFGNQTQFGYDGYDLLLTQTTDALGNATNASYDYRILQPKLVTDPNGNRQEFAFDVRGMVTKLAAMGKSGDNDGDTLTDPTTEFSYDLFAWQNSQKPNWAYTKTRETHADTGTRYLESYAYSDGLGQAVMTKSKVAPGDAFQRELDGSLSRDAQNELIIATATPRWVGNGRTILDNKGNPIKQYEPYFSSTHEYESEAELVEYGVTPVIHYDPLGRAIRTELPDDTLTRVEFNPWTQRSYDQNDTVKSSLWYTTRNSPDPDIDPEPTDKEERSAWLTAKHDTTPQTVNLDVLGRPFMTIDDNAIDGSYTMITELDIQGNPLSITDAKGRAQAFTYTYNLLGQPIKTTHLDNGTRYAINNAIGNPLRAWDSRSQAFRFKYDELLRPTHTYLIPDYDGTPGSEQLLSLTVYGESETSPETNNLRGQVYMQFDSAGLIKNSSFDFKANPLTNERQLATTYQTSPDWISLDGYTSIANLLTSASSLLESEVFNMSMAFDAQNRPTSMTKPDNSEILPGYDDGGRLVTLDAKLRGQSTTTAFVTALTYNERGQRKYITYGNGSHTTYHYDDKTFRLTRLLTTRNSGADILQDLNYTYDPVGNIVEMVDDTQETIFFNNTQVTPNTKYEYDALYRLLSATGRQMVGLGIPGNTDPTIQSLPDPTATALEVYTQSYDYDELGNILQMAHAANSSNWVKYYHYASGFADNYLLSTSTDNSQPSTDHYTYDAHGNMTQMPHLASMTWDYAERLQSADLGGGGDVYYTYDGAGDRVRKVIINGNTTEERIYLGDYEVYRKTVSGSLDTERETLHLSDDTGRIALADTLTVDAGSAVSTPTNNLRYQMSNHLGTATLELDETALVISYEEYHPFGSTSYRSGRNNAETSLKRYRYVGKERDDETGLYYYGARYYAAWLARFVSVDPLKDDYPFYTSYQYTGNNPVTFTDLDGEETTDNTVTNVPKNGQQGYIESYQEISRKIKTVDTLIEAYVEKLTYIDTQYILTDDTSVREGLIEQRAIGIEGLGELLFEKYKLLRSKATYEEQIDLVSKFIEGVQIMTDGTSMAVGVLSGGISSGVRGLLMAALEEAVFFGVEIAVSEILESASSKTVGDIGEEATEKVLREKYPNAEITSQVTGRFDDGKFTAFDFIVTEDDKIIAAVESKANTAGFTKNQRRFFKEGDQVTLFGEAAERARLSDRTISNKTVKNFISRTQVDRFSKEIISNTLKVIKARR